MAGCPDAEEKQSFDELRISGWRGVHDIAPKKAFYG
jgi:hypothetical protein